MDFWLVVSMGLVLLSTIFIISLTAWLVVSMGLVLLSTIFIISLTACVMIIRTKKLLQKTEKADNIEIIKVPPSYEELFGGKEEENTKPPEKLERVTPRCICPVVHTLRNYN